MYYANSPLVTRQKLVSQRKDSCISASRRSKPTVAAFFTLSRSMATMKPPSRALLHRSCLETPAV